MESSMKKTPVIYGFEKKAIELRETPRIWILELILMEGYLTQNPHRDLAAGLSGSLSARLRRGFVVSRAIRPPIVKVACVPHPTNRYVARMHLADEAHDRITVKSSRMLHAYLVSKAALEAATFVENVLEQAFLAFEDDPSGMHVTHVPASLQSFSMVQHVNRMRKRAEQLYDLHIEFDPYQPGEMAVCKLRT